MKASVSKQAKISDSKSMCRVKSPFLAIKNKKLSRKPCG